MKKLLSFFLSVTVLFLSCCGNIAYSQELSKYDIVINEVCASNKKAFIASNGKAPDYAELYNKSSNTVSLSGLFLTDNTDKPCKYALPNVEMKQGSFLLVLCADKPDECEPYEYYSGFSISAQKETVWLTDGTNILDSITVENANTDCSFSRLPDGGDDIKEITATPNCSNTSSNVPYAPVFSRQSGFYDDEFDVEISSVNENVKIYYTLDGSDPTVNSTLYTGAIHIDDASEHENVYSALDNLSPVINKSIVSEYLYDCDLSGEAQIPNKKTDKCTVLRAVCIDEETNRASEITNASYFVGFQDKEEFTSYKVLSLISDPDNLFNDENGIMVLGSDFYKYEEDVLKNPSSTDWRKYYWWWWDGNYRREDKVHCDIDYFSSNGNYIGFDSASLEIKGGGSRGMTQKSLNLTADKSVYGSKLFRNSYIGNKTEKGITLFSGADEQEYKTSDVLTSKLAQNLNFTVADYEPCQVFLDGEYWGFYYISDRVFSKSYYKYEYNLNTDNLSVIKSWALNEGTEADIADFQSIVDYAVNNDLKDDEKCEYVFKSIDKESLIDYYCSQIIFERFNDWPGNNWAVWRCFDESNQEYGDGKWRYILYDLNSGALQDLDIDVLENLFTADPFFASVYENDKFRQQFTNRLIELLYTAYSKENVEKAINELYNSSYPGIEKNFERYYNSYYTLEQYREVLKNIEDFFDKQRLAVSDNAIKHYKERNVSNYDSDNSFFVNDIMYDEPDNAVSHTEHINIGYRVENFSDSTCTSCGEYELVSFCSDCNAELGRRKIVLEKKQHSPVLVSGKAATYFSTGLTDGSVCSVCKEVLTPQSTTQKRKASISKLGSKASRLTVKWNKASKATGYQIQYSTSKKFTGKSTKSVKIKGNKNLSLTTKKLKSGKKYYVRVRAYQTSKGKTVYSEWSNVKSIKIAK